MTLDKIFKEKISKNEKNMTFALLGLGIIITLLGLIKGLNTIDPKYFVMIAAIVGIFISGFGVVGKLLQDIRGGVKQDSILSNTVTTIKKTTQTLEKARENFELSQNINTTTLETKDEISILKEQNKQLTLINEQQSIVLKGQGQLLNEQLSITTKQFDHIKSSELKTLYANLSEYQLLTQKFQNVSHYLYKSSCPKEVFFSLTTEQIDRIKEDSNKAIDAILLNKFTSTDNNLFGLWTLLKIEISNRLYALRLMEGQFIKENDVLYIVDKNYRNERYDSLQNFLNPHHENIWKRVNEILTMSIK